MLNKLSMRMEELEKKVANESLQGLQVAPTSATSSWPRSTGNFFRHEEQNPHMASRTGTEEISTHNEARTSNKEALSNNTNNQQPPVSTEDVNMRRQTNANNQLHELAQAPLVFADEDTKMSGETNTNLNSQLHESDLPVAPMVGEDVSMSMQPMDTGRHRKLGKQRRLQRKQSLDEDKEDFGLDEYEDIEDEGEDDDSDPEMVSIVHPHP